MMHLKYGVFVPYKIWTKAQNASSASMFVRNSSGGLWSREKLLRKADQLERTENPRVREELTPKKEGALKS